jgi:hypothetical protein
MPMKENYTSILSIATMVKILVLKTLEAKVKSPVKIRTRVED